MCSTALQVEITWENMSSLLGVLFVNASHHGKMFRKCVFLSLEMTQLNARSAVVLVGVSVAHLFFFMKSCFQ